MYGGPQVLLEHALRDGVSASRLPTFALWLAKVTLSLPAAVAARARDRLRPLPPLEHPPLFIVGHYRSGTTLLHKALAAHPDLGTVDTFDLLFPLAPRAIKRLTRPPVQAAVRRLGIRQGFFYDYPLRLDDPNEVEPWLLATGSAWSTYWGYLFPRRALEHLDRYVRFADPAVREGWKDAYDHALRRVARRCGGRRLVIKDPANTGRVDALTEVWPDARFVHVVRDPESVLSSMRELWLSVILPRFALQRVPLEHVERIVLAHYETLMEAWLSRRGGIPAGRLAEVGYDDLVADPAGAVERVARALSLPLDGRARRAIAARLAQERGFHGRPRGARDALPPGWTDAVVRWRDRLRGRAADPPF